MSLTGTACALVVVRMVFQRWKMEEERKTFPYVDAQRELIRSVDRSLSESSRQRIENRRSRPGIPVTTQ